MSTSSARAWVEIDLPAIDRNVGRIKQSLPPHVRYVAVVKANAYGHGMPEVATRLLQAGVDCFAVANVAEAAILREVGHDADILLLSPTLPTELARAVALGLDITLNSLAEAQALAALVRGEHANPFAVLGPHPIERAGRAVMAVRIAGFALSSLMVRAPGAVYVAYALPLLAIVACLLLIFARPTFAPATARLAAWLDGLASAVRTRFARPA